MKEQLQRRLIPTYFNEFQCIGGACEDTCCAGWRIDIDQKTFKKYKKESNLNIKKELQKNIKRNRSADVNEFNYGQFKMDDNNACTMLTKDGLCSIQNILGAEALCHTCTVYPREIATINNIFEKTLTLSCPEAARIILNRPEGLDFIEEEGIEHIPSLTNFTQSIEENELFWKVRIFMIDTLQNRKHSLETRLLIIAMFLQKYIELKSLNAQTIEPLVQKYNTYLKMDDLQSLFKNIHIQYDKQLQFSLSILNYKSSKEFNDLTTVIKNNLKLNDNNFLNESIEEFKLALSKNYIPFISKYAFILENYLVNAVFEKIKQANPQHIIDGFTSICVDFAMLRIFISGYLSNSESLLEDAIYIIQKYNKSLSHNSSYKSIISNILQQNHASILSQITMMIRI
ncbi:flagellin lysine-N-methylase [Kurthia populi]|uniref:Flagellin lysine-N-methylase n=1 Tax=Kurthia populi TaxID=1562132 RepID=A0ABW5Y5K1_9BACL